MESSVPEPSVVAPSLNVTVPVRVPDAAGGLPLTVAVKVTVWPDTEGLADDASVVVVGAALTVCVIVPLLAW